MPLHRDHLPDESDLEEHNPFISHQELSPREGTSSGKNEFEGTEPNKLSLQDFKYPDKDIPLDSHPLLEESFLTHPDSVSKKFGLVLGSGSGHPSWLRQSSSKTAPTEDDDIDEGNDTVHYPDTSRRTLKAPINPFRNLGQDNDKDLTYEIPMITLDTGALSPIDARSRNDLGSDLESGMYSMPFTPTSRENVSLSLQQRHTPGSPSKFSGILTRISDRIAGNNNPPSPAVEKNSSTFWDNEVTSRRSSIAGNLPQSAISRSQDASTTSFSSPSSPFVGSQEHLHDFRGDSIHSVENSTSSDRQYSHSGASQLSPISPLAPSLSRSTEEISPANLSHLKSHSSDEDTYHQSFSKLHGNSLRIFSPSSRFRKWCHRTVSYKYTNLAVTTVIFIQTFFLTYRQWNPIKNHGYYLDGFSKSDSLLVIINFFYTLEIGFKIVAYGLYDDRVMFADLGIEYPVGETSLGRTSLWSYIRSQTFEWLQRLHIYRPDHVAASSNLSTKDPSSLGRESSEEFEEIVGIPANQFESTNPFKELTHRNVSFARSAGSETSLVYKQPQTNKLEGHHTFIRSKSLKKYTEDMDIQRAFLKDHWQKLDFISVVLYWISLPLSLGHWDAEKHFMLFRTLSCLRILRLLKLTDGTNMILKACESCIPQLIDVGIFIACFWLIIGIIGVQSFKSSLTRHCVWTNPDDSTDTYINSNSYCGSYIGLDGHAHSYLNRAGETTGYVKGFRCPQYSVCQSGENPYGGTVNFDNILQSMQMVFVMISVNTFSDIMYDLMNTDNIGASLFFIFGIFILTLWLMNIFVAIIVTSFKRVQSQVAERDKSNEDKKFKLNALETWIFNNDVHGAKVQDLINRHVALRIYYRFEFVFIIVIMASLATQCFRNSEMTLSQAHTLYRAEACYTSILLFEIILRFLLFLPSIKIFILSKKNCVDLGLAIITSIIILGPVKKKLGHAYYWLTFFQCARFYRVALALRITSDLWTRILKNFKPIYDLALFYLILLCLSGILIARYFEGTVPEEDINDVEFAMHTLPNAIMSLYVITSTENWADIMYTLQEYARNISQRAFGSILLILWFIVTNLVVMNIFIAVIATSLEISLEGRRKHQVKHFIEDMTKRLQAVRAKPGWINKLKTKTFSSRDEKNMEKAVTNLLLSGGAVNEFLDGDVFDDIQEDNPETQEYTKSRFERWKLNRKKELKGLFQNPFYSLKKTNTNVANFDPGEFATRVLGERRKLIKEQDEYLKKNPNFNAVFYVLGPRHRFRRICQRIVPSSHGERIDGVEPNRTVGDIFSITMFLATVGIVVTACYLTPLYRGEMLGKYGKWNWTFYIDTSFLAIFTIEFLIKIAADGFIFTPNAYVRSSWNWLDFVALLSLWIEFVAYLKNDGNLSRIVRGLKALRALRILTISDTAKNNFHYTMISGFGKIINAGVISISLLLPFSVWGLNVFNGRLGYCLDDSASLVQCINEYKSEVFKWDIVSPRVYVNPILHMDDFSNSFSTFYQIVSLEGWVDLLINVMQSTGRGTPQRMFASPGNGLLIIFFNFVSTIFILTLFVSVIINNYSKVTGRAFLTPEQVQWYHVKKFLLQVKPSKRKDANSLKGFKKFCYMITVEKNAIWNIILNTVLILHVFTLLLEAFPTIVSDGVRYGLFMLSSTCFLVHYLMLSIGQGFRLFVNNKWNIFSLSVALGAWVSTILSFPISDDNVFVNFNKLFLVLLLIFLFPRSDRLDQLLKFASAAFPSLFSLMFTWFVIFLVYAIAMNQVFGLVKIGPNTSDNINLRSVPKSLILLFRCSFGEGWNYIMDDFTLEAPFCYTDANLRESDCGDKHYSYVLFMSWNLISMYIMLNLFVSLILDSFSYIAGGKQYAHLISRTEIRKYKRTWQKFDRDGTGFIPSQDLSKFLHSLDGALSFHFYNGILSVPELTTQWIRRNSPNNAYDIDIDIDKMNSILELMDIPKIQEKRKLYEQFIEKVLVNMELHGDPGISFTRLLIQFPLYSTFNSSDCLVFIDYMESDLLDKKVAEKLKKRRCYELIEGYACRWKYLKWKKGEISTEEFFAKESVDPSTSTYEDDL